MNQPFTRLADQPEDMKCPKVVIVVLNWNGWENTLECIQSLKNVHFDNFQVIVVDNGSNAEDLVHLRQCAGFGFITLLEQAENRGFSGGNNIGIRYALNDPRTEYVLILNNDTVVEPGFLTAMVEAARSKGADMVSATVFKYAERQTIDRLGLVISKALLVYDMKQWEGMEPFCPSGCCALYSRRLLEAVEIDGQYFDEDFFAYAEDVDLGIRAMLLGYRSALAPRAVIYHKGSAATFLRSPFSQYHTHRNTIWYLAKSVPPSVLWRHAFWILAGQILVIFTNMRRRRALLIAKAKLHGIWGIPKMLRKRRIIQNTGQPDARAVEKALDHRPFYLSAAKLMPYIRHVLGFRSKAIRINTPR